MSPEPSRESPPAAAGAAPVDDEPCPDAACRTVQALLRSVTTLLDDAPDERSLLQRYCEALTRQLPELLLAWTWFGPPEPESIRPQVYAGPVADYAASLDIPRSGATGSLAYQALGCARAFELGPDGLARLGAWGPVLHARGVRDVLALPLRSSVDDQRGVLMLYASRPRHFAQIGLPVFEALAELFGALLSRAARHQALKEAAARDPLTGLHNRQALEAQVARLQRHSAADTPAALVLMDLDHFKRINDTHGHPAGDTVLQAVAGALLSGLRAGDLCLRWGGEEFLLALPGAAGPAAQLVVEKLRLRLRGQVHPMPDGSTAQVTASFGVADLQPGEPLPQAIARADAALYAAKRGGRNRVVMD